MIVVIGAGPAGLAAAWHAARAGHEVTVVERADRVGGMAASRTVGGLRVDHGSHRLHPATDPAILAELRTLLGDDLQTRQRNGRIRVAGRWVAFPLRSGDLVRNLPARFTAGAAVDALVSPLRRARADTFGEVLRAGLGPTVAGGVYAPYARKLWDADPGELTGDLARRRVTASSPVAIARRLVRGARPEGRTFLYPRRGFGQIAEAVADAAVGAGARIELDAAVVGLDLRDADCARVVLADGSTLDAAMVLSTAPVGALVRLAVPAAPTEVVAAAGRLRHRAMVLAWLVLDRPQWTEFDAHYLPDPAHSVARLSEPRNYRESADDPPGVTVLCAELPCWEGDELWQAEPADVGQRVAAALAHEGLPPIEPVAVEVARLPRVYPVYTESAAWDLAALESWLTGHARVATLGRQGLFVPDNSHHSLAMGAAAAACLGQDGRLDRIRWSAARETFRSNVVED